MHLLYGSRFLFVAMKQSNVIISPLASVNNKSKKVKSTAYYKLMVDLNVETETKSISSPVWMDWLTSKAKPFSFGWF